MLATTTLASFLATLGVTVFICVIFGVVAGALAEIGMGRPEGWDD